MIKNFDLIKDQLSQLAPIINGFKSEAVQLKIIELVLTGTEEVEVKNTGKSDSTQRRKKPPARKAKISVGGDGKETLPKAKGKKTGKRIGTSSRPGPLEMVNRLISEGFFNKKKSLNEILVFCKEKYAYVYKNNDFSPTLGRAVRSKLLSREKNTEGQYEYIKI